MTVTNKNHINVISYIVWTHIFMRMTYWYLCGIDLVSSLRYWNPNPRNFELYAGSEKNYQNN
jgi:hypothetical protein